MSKVFDKVVYDLKINKFIVGKWYKTIMDFVVIPVLYQINERQYVETFLIIDPKKNKEQILDEVKDFIYSKKKFISTREIDKEKLKNVSTTGYTLNLTEWENLQRRN